MVSFMVGCQNVEAKRDRVFITEPCFTKATHSQQFLRLSVLISPVNTTQRLSEKEVIRCWAYILRHRVQLSEEKKREKKRFQNWGGEGRLKYFWRFPSWWPCTGQAPRFSTWNFRPSISRASTGNANGKRQGCP